jgi:hypothetical protein
MIAKISIGGGFGGALDYLMKVKEKERQEEKERAQEQSKEQAERTREREADAPERTRQRVPERGELKGDGQQEKEAHPSQREAAIHPSAHERDLADGYELGQRHRIIGGNMGGRNSRELAREFGAFRELRPDIEKPVHHASISAGENDRLTVEQWNEIAAKYVEQMGFKDSPYVVIQHRDNGLDHIHIVTSRIDINGQVVSEWQNKPRSEKIMREVEREYGLEQVKPSREVMRAAPTRGEIEMLKETGKLSAKMSMQGHVERALRDDPTVEEFIEKLERVGVEVIPNLQSTGRASGISFRQGKEVMKGSDLGRGFSWGALQQRGLDYEPERDRPVMEAAKQRAEMGRTFEPINTLPVPMPGLEPSFVETARDMTQSAGQYLLERANPLDRIGKDLYLLSESERALTTAYTTTQDLLSHRDGVDQLHRVAGQPPGQDTLEQLHHAAGLETPRDEHGALDRLHQATGLERENPSATPTLSPDTATVEHALEHEAEERTMEAVIEIAL